MRHSRPDFDRQPDRYRLMAEPILGDNYRPRPEIDTIRGKENAMIELKQDQLQSLDAQEQPPIAVDPRTGQEYLPIKREVYELVRGILKPCGRGWDDPADDDLIKEPA